MLITNSCRVVWVVVWTGWLRFHRNCSRGRLIWQNENSWAIFDTLCGLVQYQRVVDSSTGTSCPGAKKLKKTHRPRATRNLSPNSDFHSSHLWPINTHGGEGGDIQWSIDRVALSTLQYIISGHCFQSATVSIRVRNEQVPSCGQLKRTFKPRKHDQGLQQLNNNAFYEELQWIQCCWGGCGDCRYFVLGKCQCWRCASIDKCSRCGKYQTGRSFNKVWINVS